MTKHYENAELNFKSVEDISKYKNQMLLGLDAILNQDVLIDIRDTKNIAITGTAGYGIPLLVKNLLVQITKEQETLGNLFILGKNPSEYDYFIEKGAKGSSTYKRDERDNNLDSTIDEAYNHFKEGKPTIFVINKLEELNELAEKDLLKMVKELLDSDNARVILINTQKTSISNLCNLQIEQYYSKKLRGYFIVNRLNPFNLETFESFIVKPPVVLN